MAKRETYTTKIKCGSCGAEGKGTFSENENPVFSRGDLNRLVDSVSDGFRENAAAPEGISCDKCGSTDVKQA